MLQLDHAFLWGDCISVLVMDAFVMDSMYSKLNSLSLTRSIYALAASVFQLVTSGCGKLHVVDLFVNGHPTKIR